MPANGSQRISGTVRGYKATVYAVTLAAGETLEARFDTRSTSAYFNIIDGADASGVALHHGEMAGKTASLTASRPTTFLIQPYMVRAAARRGSVANYTIDISRRSGAARPAAASAVAATSGAAAQPSTFAPASAATIRFNATGPVKCSAGTPSHDRMCNFGVVRRGGGAATVHVTRPSPGGPAGAERILEFASGDVKTPQPGRLTWGKQGDTWYVGIDNNEFYVIPEAVVTGG